MINSMTKRWEGKMTRMGEFHTEFWWNNLKKDLKDLGARRRIILKYHHHHVPEGLGMFPVP